MVNGNSVSYSLHPYSTSSGDPQTLYSHTSSAHHHGPTVFSALGGGSLGSLGGMGEIKSVMQQGLDAASAGSLPYQQGKQKFLFSLKNHFPASSYIVLFFCVVSLFSLEFMLHILHGRIACVYVY